MADRKFIEYNIVIHTTLGNKKGTLSAEIEGDTLECTVKVMKNENLFSGTINYYGKFKIKGHIKTLTNIVECDGEGYLDDSTITFTLNAEGRNLIVTGTSVI